MLRRFLYMAATTTCYLVMLKKPAMYAIMSEKCV